MISSYNMAMISRIHQLSGTRYYREIFHAAIQGETSTTLFFSNKQERRKIRRKLDSEGYTTNTNHLSDSYTLWVSWRDIAVETETEL